MKMGEPVVRNRRPAKVTKTVRTGGNTPPTTVSRAVRTGGNLPASRVATKKIVSRTAPANTGVVPPHMKRASTALDRLGRKPSRKAY